MQYADIIVNHQIGKKTALTYAISPEQLPYIAVGSVVLVPLGKKKIHGVIVRLHRGLAAPLKQKLKPIAAIVYPGSFVPPYLLKSVFQLEKGLNYPIFETLFRLLPNLPRRPQKMVSFQQNSTHSHFQVFSYQISYKERESLYKAIWKRIKEQGQSLMIICPSKDRVKALADSLKNKEVPFICQPDISPSKQREYYLNSLTTSGTTIFIGTRSMLATSLITVGGIIIDEPWLPGHKDDRSPKWWTAFVAFYLCRIRSIPLFLVSSVIWPEDIYFKPEIKVFAAEYGKPHLIIEHSQQETSELNDIFSLHNSFQVIHHSKVKSLYWCLSCRKICSQDPCSTCNSPTRSLSNWTKETILQSFPSIQASNFFSFEQLHLLHKSSIIVSFGLDAFLAVTDYRSSLYLSTLLSCLRERCQTLYMVTRHPEAWTSILTYMDSYSLKEELQRRKKRSLPPYSIPLFLTSKSKQDIEDYCLSINSSIIYRGAWHKVNSDYRLFILLDAKQLLLLHRVDRKNIKVELFPNYISNS